MIRTPQKFIPSDPFKDFGVEVPRPKKFPVSFDEMLRCLMPQVETKIERQKRYFDHLQEFESCDLINGERVPVGNIPLKDASDLLEKMKREKYHELNYCLHGQHFLRWWAERLAKRRSAIGKKGGRPKNSLDDVKNG
ncbi:MAG: hypothetical protein P4L87_17650 [Formivibrio sp.]|nr:hypothetical protein [Formivibrio sp.]